MFYGKWIIVMNILDQIKIANEECETVVERFYLWYRIIIGFGICIPLLYIVGFITGCLMFKNPIQAGIECVRGMF